MNSHPYPSPEMQNLFKAIRTLRNEKEYADFFRDLLTIKELEEIAMRWKIARQLNTGRSYVDIAQDLNVSTTTVTRVAHWLNHGRDGYRIALKRMKK